MKGELIPGLACSTEEFATTSPTRSYTPKTCKAELERNHAAEKNPEASPGDRRIRLMLQGSRLSLHPMVKKDTASRRIRPSGGKDRHSKVNTAKGPRDRRVRLSVSTAIEFYDVQDRLGYDQPSKAVEWLLREAKTAIDKLPQLHDALVTLHRSNTTPSGSPTHGHFSSSNGREEFLVGMSDVARTQHQYESGLMMQEIIGARNIVSNETPNDQATGTHTREFSSAIGLQSSGAAISSARIQLRTKARERARERAKEFIKCSIYNESGSKASCSTRPNPSSKTGHGDLLHYSKSVGSHDLECMGRPDHQLENIVPRPNSHEHLQNFHLRESLQVDDRFPNTFRHDVHTEQVDDETLSIQDATRNNPIIPSPNFVHATEVHDFSHHKYQKLPNILSQPSQSRPPANTRESCSSGLLYYSSRKPLFSTPNYLDSRNMAFQHENPAPLPSCSNAISHGMAFFEVPISSGKTLSSFISPVDPTQSAFRYQTSHLAALHEDQEALISSHFPNKKILINAQSSSSGSRLTANYHMLFPQAAEVSQLAFPSAFEPFSNQTPGSVYSRTSSDFQNCEHPLFSSRDSDTLQSNALKLPARLRGLDDIEEQLKRYSHS